MILNLDQIFKMVHLTLHDLHKYKKNSKIQSKYNSSFVFSILEKYLL